MTDDIDEVVRLLKKTSFEEVQLHLREAQRVAAELALAECGWTEAEFVAEFNLRYEQ